MVPPNAFPRNVKVRICVCAHRDADVRDGQLHAITTVSASRMLFDMSLSIVCAFFCGDVSHRIAHRIVRSSAGCCAHARGIHDNYTFQLLDDGTVVEY